MNVEATFSFSDPGFQAFDLADPSPRVTAAPQQVNTSVVGQVIVLYTATDASGNSCVQNRTITIRDTLSPVITMNGSPLIFADKGKPFADPGATAFDLLDKNVTASIVVRGLEHVNTSGPLGRVFAYNYTCSDLHGNSAVVTRYVQIYDK